MAGQSLYPAYDRALHGRLAEYLRKHRANGLSFDAIAIKMYDDHAIAIDPDTWRRWYHDFVVTDDEQATAT